MFKALIEKGAKARKVASNGRSALDYAKKYKQRLLLLRMSLNLVMLILILFQVTLLYIVLLFLAIVR